MRKVMMLVLLLALLALAGTAVAAFPDTIPLPHGFQPEGVVMGKGTTIYAGSLADGAIYRADVRTGAGEIFIPGAEGRITVGLDFDPRTGYLYAAGGPTGMAFVFDTESGELVADYVLRDESPTFVNDVVVTREAAYFTESNASQFYRLDLETGAVTTIELDASYPFDPAAFNSNGIVASPNGEWLILANSGAAGLYRVDPETGASEPIDLGGQALPAVDGLVLQGNRIYAVQNALNQITEIKLSSDYLSGEVVEVITDEDFSTPTTATKFGSALYAVNARFFSPGYPDLDFDIVRVKR